MGTDKSKKVTVPLIRLYKSKGKKITMVTAYDYPTARIVDEAGIDIILVGDSLGNVVLGYENTLPVTMQEMLHHTKAVKRGVKRALLVADMPYLSYQIDIKDALINAGKFIKEAGAEAIKIEGGSKNIELIKRLIDCEIPVMGHIGLTPQSLLRFGGYKVQGKSQAKIDELIRDSKELEKVGVFSIVLEGIPYEVSKIITQSLSIPTIGIGAGPYCDGQVLVFHDLVGLSPEPIPKFVKKYLNARELFINALKSYIKDVEENVFPDIEHSYKLPQKLQKNIES